MKKLPLLASLAAIGFALTAFTTHKALSDSNFEGIVTYSSSMLMNGKANPNAGHMPPMKMYIKGGKTKVVSDMGTQKRITITDCNNPDNPIVLAEMNGNKYQLKNEPTQKTAKDPVITYSDETKTIAGYTCHKAEMTMTDDKGQSTTMDVYYAEDISRSACDKRFKGLKGFPLEYTVNTHGMTMTTTATSVDKQSLSDDEFTVPPGYKLVTQQEMQQEMMKSMGAGGR
ncbi:MAG: hypothetical protein ACLQQ4_18200 [Bacteroidia bacterium]